MALQGTLDTFALPDVLRLLASTKKTGRLRLNGDRGEGSVWVDGGTVVATESTGSGENGTAVDVVFELLRYADGSFTFEAGSTTEGAGAPSDVEPLLSEAEDQLVEWREIEKVVPSIDAWVVLASELPGDEVAVDSTLWRTIVSIGSGTTVAAIGEALGLAEVAVCRRVKDIVELGLGAVLAPSAAPAATTPVVDDASPVMPALRDLPAIDEIEVPWERSTNGSDEMPSFQRFSLDVLGSTYEEEAVAEAPAPAPIVEAQPEPAPQADVQPAPVEAQPETVRVEAPMGFGAADDEAVDADEVARQLASLSPRAARAVAAAARAETMEEREAALAGVTGEDDEPINRGLLLKFLSSVRT